ncbi:MAG TPA: CopD family protein [Caulobacterales bacterium]|jgi:putative membrane protein|nr:CopD family protein [Caulobacterales bacterium]
MILDGYNLARGLHIIAVIAWMAGLMMLPRFYAYQTEAEPGGELEKKMIEASAKLRTIILTPSMIAVWALGLYLVFSFHRDHLLAFWLVAKLSLVIVLSGIHGFFIAEGKKLARGERPRTARFWRVFNEVPFIIAIVVVLLVTLKPT